MSFLNLSISMDLKHSCFKWTATSWLRFGAIHTTLLGDLGVRFIGPNSISVAFKIITAATLASMPICCLMDTQTLRATAFPIAQLSMTLEVRLGRERLWFILTSWRTLRWRTLMALISMCPRSSKWINCLELALPYLPPVIRNSSVLIMRPSRSSKMKRRNPKS